MKNLFYDFLKEISDTYKDRTAILYDTMEVSFEKLFEDAVKKAIHLMRYDGKSIALYGPLSYRTLVNLFGVLLAGKNAVIIDFFLPPEVRFKLLDKVGVEHILCSTNQYVLSDSKAKVIEGAEKDDVTGLNYNKPEHEGCIVTFTATADQCDRPIVIGNENIFAAVDAIRNNFNCGEDDKVLAMSGIHNSFGLIYSLFWPLKSGACVCIGRGLKHIDADTTYYNPTILPLNPATTEYMRKISTINLGVKQILIGEAPGQYRLIDYLRRKGIQTYSIYGMDECCGCIGYSYSDDGAFDEMIKGTVQIDGDGKIVVSGPCVARGYADYSEKNTNMGGFAVASAADSEAGSEEGQIRTFNTGHSGRMDENSKIFVSKLDPDIILLPTGENISRRVTCSELAQFSGVEAAYFTKYKEKLTAVILPLDKEEKKEHFVRRIRNYNKKKGYRWEIEKLVLLDQMPEESDMDKAIEEIYESRPDRFADVIEEDQFKN